MTEIECMKTHLSNVIASFFVETALIEFNIDKYEIFLKNLESIWNYDIQDSIKDPMVFKVCLQDTYSKDEIKEIMMMLFSVSDEYAWNKNHLLKDLHVRT